MTLPIYPPVHRTLAESHACLFRMGSQERNVGLKTHEKEWTFRGLNPGPHAFPCTADRCNAKRARYHCAKCPDTDCETCPTFRAPDPLPIRKPSFEGWWGTLLDCSARNIHCIQTLKLHTIRSLRIVHGHRSNRRNSRGPSVSEPEGRRETTSRPPYRRCASVRLGCLHLRILRYLYSVLS